MLVVSDATPLISLMKAERLDTLGRLFGEALIPCAVYSELTSNPRFRDETEQIEGSAFIKVVEVEERTTVDLLLRATGLDLGESEAIVYADGAGADVLLGFDELMRATNTHFVQADAAEASKNGTLQKLVVEYFGK